MSEKVYLAFDLGASSGRAILGRLGEAGAVELEEVHRFANGPVVRDDGLFWDLEGLYGHMLEAMRIVARRGVAPRAIGIDTWGVDFGLLDKAGELLEPPRCYRESRNAGMSERIVSRIGAERLLERTGAMHQDHASLCQLAAAAEGACELLARAKSLLFIPDLLRLWLCGAPAAGVTDCTFASCSQMYDVVKREWATEILAELSLPTDILPEVRTGPTVVGRLCEAVRGATGLGEVPVVAGCGHDTGAAFGACLPDLGGRIQAVSDLGPLDELAVISSGTWAILGVFVDSHLPAGSLDPKRFGYEANPDGSLRIVSNLVGGWLIEQCRKVWADQGIDCSYEALIAGARQAAGAAKASAILDTSWEGFLHPASMPEAIAEHCRATGQPTPESPGEFAQVIFASLATSYAAGIDELRCKSGRPLGTLLMMGGMARNEYLNELTAERAGVNVIVGPAEATALGNIAVQHRAMEDWGQD